MDEMNPIRSVATPVATREAAGLPDELRALLPEANHRGPRRRWGLEEILGRNLQREAPPRWHELASRLRRDLRPLLRGQLRALLPFEDTPTLERLEAVLRGALAERLAVAARGVWPAGAEGQVPDELAVCWLRPLVEAAVDARRYGALAQLRGERPGWARSPTGAHTGDATRLALELRFLAEDVAPALQSAFCLCKLGIQDPELMAEILETSGEVARVHLARVEELTAEVLAQAPRIG